LNERRLQLTKQVKEANDIVAVISSYLHLAPAGSKYKGLCPFHDDNRPSLTVDPKFQNFKCWPCGKTGDVFTFIQEYEKVSFPEAVELLARRVGIALDAARGDDGGKFRLTDALKWAADLYRQVLLDDPQATLARQYLGERKLLGDTVHRFGLGYAPDSWDWLTNQIDQAPVPKETLIEAGLIKYSDKANKFFDTFRGRVMFPIRDLRGQIVGFGGRVLPELAKNRDVGPKYLNSADNPVFKKGELVYGMDLARTAAQAAGYLAIVEGYTDVLMAHQHGIHNVVATLGTALTADHIRQIRRFAAKVVLVYDADAGGATGVDRALELFVREDLDLAVATLPPGLDPCDTLVQHGPEVFRHSLESATSVLDFKLEQYIKNDPSGGIEAGRRAVESVLGVLAVAPQGVNSAADVRRELMLNRMAQRFGLRLQTLQQRLAELRRQRPRDGDSRPAVRIDDVAVTHNLGTTKADPLERQLIQLLLAEPTWVSKVKAELTSDDITHPEVRRVITEMFTLVESNLVPDIDAVRMRLIDSPRIADYLLRLQEVGLMNPDRGAWLNQILKAFRDRRAQKTSMELKGTLKATQDPVAALELLRKLQQTALAPAMN
jgi:DNA primase